MERVTPDLMRLFVALPGNETLPFVAGQYINIILEDGARGQPSTGALAQRRSQNRGPRESCASAVATIQPKQPSAASVQASRAAGARARRSAIVPRPM